MSQLIPALCVFYFAVDCLDPTCSGRGVCVRGECHCFVGWGGPGCESPRASCMEQCSGHGTFLADTNTCNCDHNWTGHDCSTGQNSGRFLIVLVLINNTNTRMYGNTSDSESKIGCKLQFRLTLPTLTSTNTELKQILISVKQRDWTNSCKFRFCTF